MTFWEFLHLRGERIAARRGGDPRLNIGAIFLLGYFCLVALFVFYPVPPPNKDLVRDGALVLGPAVGAIIQALFRTDGNDEQRTENTREAFRAVRAAAESRNPSHQETVSP